MVNCNLIANYIWIDNNNNFTSLVIVKENEYKNDKENVTFIRMYISII